ncbi:unnamed protein product [Adineta ricciae]|uniref:CRAL-TRIO domain-containing protein n=1 Tax=Adineta ricciae TaxID=249248 RepID=A0A814V1H4_ADIRI|nr:unnamed protein product [Adineta ricciae]CAF1179377.1 unnamed protein product [Adineta ricciae]
MAAPVPQFQTFISVKEFRELVQKTYEKEIAEDEKIDARDLQRFNENDDYTLRFIQHGQHGTTFDQERALRLFKASMEWRKRHNVYDISTSEFPAEFITRQALFFKNQDRHNNPLLHIAVRKLDKSKDDKEAVKRFLTYTFEEHLRQHPEQKIVLVFDMSETGLSHMDYELVKFIIASAQHFYPRLLAYMLIFKMPWLLTAAWKLIKTWLPPEADQFIKFVDEKSIQDYIAPDQLSEAMGGTARYD